MSSQPENEKSLKRKAVVLKTTSENDSTTVKQKVLEEEQYLSVLEKIIERDFYPELSKLRLRTSYLDALGSNNLEKLRQIQIALEQQSGTPFTDGPFTPLPTQTTTSFDNISATPQSGTSNQGVSRESGGADKFIDSRLTLDKFLIQNTSEDNASFDNIIEATREKQRELHAWLYPHDEQGKLIEGSDAATTISTTSLAITNRGKDDRKMIEMGDRPNTVETWPYIVKNDLMYNPKGLALTQAEKEEKRLGAKEIHHENTRFRGDPFDANAFKSTMAEAAKERERLNRIMKKVGVDGELENMTSTGDGESVVPEFQRFVDTPSPAPGVDASPLMTWGAIEGTPQHIAATPSHSGPKFKIHDIQKREQIAISLADKVGKRHREERKRAAAAKAASSSIFSPKATPRLMALTAERVSKLTPAAQKLMKKASSSVHRDSSLQASYTPMLSESGTPTPGGSKKKKMLTPSVKTPAGGDGTRTPSSVRGSSITDNLLNIPPS